MRSSPQPALCPPARRCPLKVCWWRSVCVLYPVLCLVALPSRPEAVKARCGRELVADLEFVCGDRGFYRGKVSGGRYGARLRGRGIVEQCCLRACDLQHLEAYCAKPARNRRHAPSHAPSHAPPPSTEVLFQAVLRKRIWALYRPVLAGAQPLPGTLTQRLQPLPGTLTQRLQPLPGTLTQRLQPLPGALTQRLQPLPGTLTQRLQPLPGTLRQRLQPLPGALTQRLQPLPGALTQRLQPLPGTLTQRLQPLPGTLTQRLQTRRAQRRHRPGQPGTERHTDWKTALSEQ